MRVALYNLTTTTKVGGVETFVWEVARELARRGIGVEVLGGRGGSPTPPPEGVPVRRYPYLPRRLWQRLPPLGRAYAYAKLLERLSMAPFALPDLVRRGYDLVHIQKPYDLGPALLARALGGGRVILGSHGEDFYLGDRFLARRVDGAVACSRFNARTVAARYGFEPVVIYNGIDATLFRPHPRDEARRRWGIGPDLPLLLYVGRLVPWKGVQYAVEALTHLPGAHLWIAGEGHHRPALEALARARGVEDRVRFLGAVPHERLPGLYSAADLLVATSFASETFGIALAEAQACGTPVVAARFGGFPEVVRHGETGFLVPPQDPQALAWAARLLLEDPGLRAWMGRQGRAWILEQFTWRAVVDRLLPVYEAALEKDGGG